MTQDNTREMTPEEIAEREEWEAGEYNRQVADIEQVRRSEYTMKSDPLFFGYQRGENTQKEWLDAVQAIKDAHPYPEAPTKG